MRYHAQGQQRSDATLRWRSFDQGRLVLATAAVGYFELMPGKRFRHIRLTDEGMVVTDLGPCSHALLSICKKFCERHHHQIAGDVLV